MQLLFLPSQWHLLSASSSPGLLSRSLVVSLPCWPSLTPRLTIMLGMPGPTWGPTYMHLQGPAQGTPLPEGVSPALAPKADVRLLAGPSGPV